MDHVLEEPGGLHAHVEAFEDLARFRVGGKLAQGRRLRMVKLLAYGWSGERSAPALRDQVAAAAAMDLGWEGMVVEQRGHLDEFWGRCDVELDGDPELQQAIRFGLFHTLRAGARGEQRAIAAKGLTGPGYDGHTFWDTEMFVLPLLTYTSPSAAADELRWRQRTLGLARDRARTLGLKVAAFPWRTIHGQECSSYWPAGTGAFHISADIADAVNRYVAASRDAAFERDTGLELLVETARLWRSLGHHDMSGRFRIDGVTGPDEYSAIADNNVYTNLMAQRNLRTAADAAERHPDRADSLGVSEEETAEWRNAAAAMLIPTTRRSASIPRLRSSPSTSDGTSLRARIIHYPLLLNFPYFDLYRKQVVKQADLVLALLWCGDSFTPEQKNRDFEYYEGLTVRDSSLSVCIQAILATETGHLDLAYDYFAEAALLDLEDREHNTRDGIHIASVAGTWLAAVAGFGGMRDHGGKLSFSPRLPKAITRLKFSLWFEGRSLRAEIDHSHAHYSQDDGPPLEIHHYGTPVEVRANKRLTLEIPETVARTAPVQPVGRSPARRIGHPQRADHARGSEALPGRRRRWRLGRPT